jgi:hypothetical protein
MSPEQAEGKRLDGRSDIFSFGLVLYEMITGQPAFRGASTASTLAAILRDEPRRINDIVPDVPVEIDRIIARCMKKDPARRFQHMDDVKVQLQEIKEDHESGRLATAAPLEAVAYKRNRPWRPIVLLAVLVLGIAGLLWWFSQRVNPPAEMATPVLTRLTADAGLTFQPSLSPDGKLIAYSSDRAGDGGLDIWVQQLAGGDPVRLTHDPADEQDPSFSPDGSRIVFTSGREGGGVYLMSALGGAQQKIAEDGIEPRFSPDGNWIAYRTGDRLSGVFVSGAAYVVPAAGGIPRRTWRPSRTPTTRAYGLPSSASPSCSTTWTTCSPTAQSGARSRTRPTSRSSPACGCCSSSRSSPSYWRGGRACRARLLYPDWIGPLPRGLPSAGPPAGSRAEPALS